MTNPITTLSRERLEQLADENTICKVSWDERIEMARALLAVMDTKPREPDYYIHRVEVCDSYGPDVELRAFNNALDASKCKDDHGGEVVELFSTPPAASVPDVNIDQAKPGTEATVFTHFAEPAGYRLVPIYPTQEMRDAWFFMEDFDSEWAAMLAASPKGE